MLSNSSPGEQAVKIHFLSAGALDDESRDRSPLVEEIVEGSTEDGGTGSGGENEMVIEAVVAPEDTQGGATQQGGEKEGEVVSDSSPEDENVAPPIIQVRFCS